MPTHILRPTSVVTPNNWDVFSGVFLANISDASDGTAVYNTDHNDEFVVEYENLTLPANIVSVTSNFRHSRSGGGIEIRQFVRIPSVANTYGAWIAPGAIATTNEVLACPSGAWSRGVVNGIQGGCVSRTGSPTEEGYVYDLWLSVLTRGGSVAFADLLSLVFGGGVFPAMAWQQFEAVRRELFRLTGTKILDDEVRAAIDAMRCDPRPRYFTA